MKSSITEFYKFLDHADERGILPTGTVQGRRAAAKAVFGVLEAEGEATVEYVIQNLDSVFHRYTVKNRGEVRGQTLETYKSRIRSALQDFVEWSKDPAGWERGVMARTRKLKAVDDVGVTAKTKSAKPSTKDQASAREVPLSAASLENGQSISLPIRKGSFTVSANIPADGLTFGELKKLGNWLSLFLQEDGATDRSPELSRMESTGHRNGSLDL